ncbi:MAG: SH3 domain-containing protein [Pseudomonadales bacterium]
MRVVTKISHAALVVGLTCFYPVQADAQNLFKDLGNSIKRDIQKITKPKNNNNNAPGKIIGGLAGAAIGAKLSDAFDSNEVLGTVIGTAVGVYVGNEIQKSLSQQQQDKVAGATVDAFVSGQNQEWTDPETNSRNTIRVVETDQRNQPVSIMVDRNSMAEIADIDLIGETYSVVKGSNIRGGPGTNFAKVGGVAAGNRINVVGKVRGEPWYMVSRNGIAYGYIYEPLVKPQSASIVTEPIKQPPETLGSVETVVVAASQECRTVEQSVASNEGETFTETMTACKGGNGWEIKVAAVAPELLVEPLPGQSNVLMSDADPLPIVPLTIVPALPVVDGGEATALPAEQTIATYDIAENKDGYLSTKIGVFEILSMVGGSAWCGRHVATRIDYPQGAFDLFNARSAPSEATEFARAAKELCPEIRSIQFSHNPDRGAGEELFSYADIQWLSAADDFTNLTTYKRIEEALPAEKANRCDELAAIPNDPRKPLGVAPIPDAQFAPADEAKNACFQAVLLDANDSRHLTHLGRVLAFQGDFEGAVAALTKAKAMGNGSAMQYLGTLMVEGWGTAPDMRGGNAEWNQAKLYGEGLPNNPDAISKSAGVERRN